MSAGGRSSSHSSGVLEDTTVVIQAPPPSSSECDGWASEKRLLPAQATTPEDASLPSSCSTSPKSGAAETSQHRSRQWTSTQVPALSARISRQSDAAVAVVLGTVTEAALPIGATADVQVVAELKSELYHMSRNLVQARQQVRSNEEACAELRRRCQTLETERLGLQLELQEAQQRLQARHAQTEEQRREAAEAKLTVLSLTAERDELSAKVQEAWDRAAELSAALRRQETEMQRLQEGIRAAQHSKDLTVQQHLHVEQQLRILQEQLRMHEVSEHTSAAAHQRLSAALQRALERLARLLSNVAYDYQRSLAYESQDNEEGTASEMLARVATNGKTAGDEVTRTKNHAGSIPHIVLFPANSHSPSALTEKAVVETQPFCQSGSANESARVHAESALHSAEAAVLGDLWGAEQLPWTLSAPSHDELSAVPGSTSAGSAAVTPPERRPPSPASSRHALVQSHRPNMSKDAPLKVEVASQLSTITALADEASLRTALTPLLLALKHVAAMLSSVRSERRRWVAETMHFKQCYEEVQHQLEASQHLSASYEIQVEEARAHIGALKCRVEHAEAALLECRNDDMRRRGSLAETLKCAEDWALIQHSVGLLQVRHSELSKDIEQLQKQLQAASAFGVERMEQAACAAAAEVRYQQLNQPYRTLKESVETTWSTGSYDFPKAQSGEHCASTDTPVAPPAVDSLSSSPPLPPPAGHGATSAPLVAPPITGNAAAAGEEKCRSPSMLPHCTSMALATVSSSPQHREKEVQDPGVLSPYKYGGVREGDISTAPQETMSASSAVANGKTNALGQPRVEQISSPSVSSPAFPFITSAKVENRVHDHTYDLAHPPHASAPAINGGSSSPRFRTPPSTAYPTSLSAPSSTTLEPPMHGSAHEAERIPLASHHRDQGRSWSSVPAPHIARSPPPSSTARDASSDVVTSPDRGVVNGAVDYSSMFATEVLHVIEALDRRVSGALDRSLHA